MLGIRGRITRTALIITIRRPTQHLHQLNIISARIVSWAIIKYKDPLTAFLVDDVARSKKYYHPWKLSTHGRNLNSMMPALHI
jgi:hypothetical protein